MNKYRHYKVINSFHITEALDSAFITKLTRGMIGSDESFREYTELRKALFEYEGDYYKVYYELLADESVQIMAPVVNVNPDGSIDFKCYRVDDEQQ